MADHSRVSAEDVERAARWLFDFAMHRQRDEHSWEDTTIDQRAGWIAKAREFLSSIEAVPRAEAERLREIVNADFPLVVRASRAEARCESYRTALEELTGAMNGQQFRPPVVAAWRKARAALAVPQEGKPR